VVTPRIDRLTATGLRFTSGYSACTVCSPARATLLTGQHPVQLHLADVGGQLPTPNPDFDPARDRP
jgi:arylsulfatase A